MNFTRGIRSVHITSNTYLRDFTVVKVSRMHMLSILTLLVVISIATEVASQRSRERSRGRPSGRRTSKDAIELGQNFQPGVSPRFQCPQKTLCSDQVRQSAYRTADGSCNNLNHTDWGRALIPMRRFLKPEYDDDFSTPRGSQKVSLPNARLVSLSLHTLSDENQNNAAGITHFLMQWGQFLDHDITLTSIKEEPNEGEVTTRYVCCKDDEVEGVSVAGQGNLSVCFPIDIDKETDLVFKSRDCLDFVRSVQVRDANCEYIAEQVNQITAYIDASNVYGSSEEEIQVLRESSADGYLEHEGSLLPRNDDATVCNSDASNYCFHAGDERVNEQVALTCLHTIWMKEHNRIASILLEENPTWVSSPDKIFDETRKIIGAMMQQITYGEFLPEVLGEATMLKYDLKLAPSGHRNIYNPDLDASIHNAFATAAYRFGHSLVRQVFSMYNANAQVTEQKNLVDMFGETSIIHSDINNVEKILRGLASENAKDGDRFLNSDLIHNLFEVSDLAALNIQRGRDHGLPGYSAWRLECKLPVPPTDPEIFESSFTDISGPAAMLLRMLYNKIEGIDLFTAGLAENKVPGGLVGPTFACILGRQFKRLMRGDRFWFELPGRTGFRPEQLAELRKVTLASVLCNVANMTDIQPKVFRMAMAGNEKRPCDRFPQPDFSKWKETDSSSQSRPSSGRRRP